ncbi:hypothetical protein DICVIV_13422 [Dictyocaulus viviparus]|uniref:Uncharacterized protein n=1 Tax=Dictyocaulus viviparus TaxID=29172 RepID=A0A0D8XAE7_DICVI|nr:hypothetical protein DICVIV_13422 [Dictyocaulus viviparus]
MNLKTCNFSFELMRKGGQEKKFAANIKIVVQQVAEERRRDRVFNFLHSTVDKDQAVKLTEFYNSWCQLTTVLDEEEYETCRLAGLRLVLSVLNTRSILPLYLSILYDLFVKQVQLCDNEQVLSLLEIHSGSLLVSNLSSRYDCEGFYDRL